MGRPTAEESEGSTVDQQELATLWEEATTLQDGQAGQESPLTRALFQEALEASEPSHNPQDVANALYAVGNDAEGAGESHLRTIRGRRALARSTPAGHTLAGRSGP